MVLDEDGCKRAVAEKDVGNSHYKKKEFQKALDSYNRAIEIDPTNVIFYTNKAAVFFEQGEHEKCRETCLKAVDVGRMYNSDPRLIAKALGRIGNSFMKQKRYDQAKDFFLKSVREYETIDMKEKLDNCEKEIEQLAYINPDVSRVIAKKGDIAFRDEKVHDALKHYTEAIKRNPDDPRLYLSRATVFMKLLMHSEALKDCEDCITKDGTVVKGHICKGAALEALGKFDDALNAYSKAAELDPNEKEASEAYYRCVDRDYRLRNSTAAIFERAKENSEVQKVLSDPELQHMIINSSINPEVEQKLLNDSNTANSIRKLLEYGLLKVT